MLQSFPSSHAEDYDLTSTRKPGKYSNRLTEQERYDIHIAKYHTPLDTTSPKYPKKVKAALERWTKNGAEQGKKRPPNYTLNYLDVPPVRHWHRRKVKSKTGAAKRLDIHPLAAERRSRAASPRLYMDGYVPGGRSENIALPSQG